MVLIHGGFWRQIYTKRLMHRMAEAVVAHGWVAYNVEYRRVGPLGQGGWPQTFDDVSAAIGALAGVKGVDLGRVVTCGHSAGGHLALWAASGRVTATARVAAVEPPVQVRAAISLAGVVDLEEAARRNLGGGAVQGLLGGGPDELPDRYRAASPAALLPLGIPQVLVHGLDDTAVPSSMSADYAERARSLGDDATFVPIPATGHMEMIDPGGAAFGEVLACMGRIAAS
jgi:acetyl esterase/lipase